MRCALPVACIPLAAAFAAWLRLPDLADRPMHVDEAVHAVKFNTLWETGKYVYDPSEYHGPTLYYATLLPMWLSGARTFGEMSEATLRLVPALFGIGLILLLPLVFDGLGRAAAAWAGLLTAVSPAFVYYSRYYIQEMLLVFFTFALIAAGWRFLRTRRIAWAIGAGLGLGLMHATKETCLIAWACIALAVLVAHRWCRAAAQAGGAHDKRARGPVFRPAAVVAALLCAAATSVLLFTACFTNLCGPIDSFRTYPTYFDRAGNRGLHNHPWNFYFHRLLYYHEAPGPAWSEATIVALALVGAVTTAVGGRRRAARGGEEKPEAWPPPAPPPDERPTQADAAGRNDLGQPSDCIPERAVAGAARSGCRTAASITGDPRFLRFVLVYTVSMTTIYTLIPYKTPWCMLGFLHGMVLLAGVGAAALIRAARSGPRRAVLAVLLLVTLAPLAADARRSISTRFSADNRNPYVYAHTLRGVYALVDSVERIAAVQPDGRRMLVQVMSPADDFWPLPWYLRRFERIGWWDHVPPDPDADILIAETSLQPELESRVRDRYPQINLYGVRPDVRLAVYVRENAWEAFLRRQRAATTSPGEPGHTRGATESPDAGKDPP